MPLNQFLKTVWHKYLLRFPAPYKNLLTQTQALYLWQQCFEKEYQKMLPMHVLQVLWEAWKIIHDFKINASELKQHATHPDQFKAIKCFDHMRTYYHTHHLIDEATLTGTLLKHIDSVANLLKDYRIECYAFLDSTPMMQAFFSKLSDSGIQLNQMTPPKKKKQAHLFEFSHEQDELAAMIDYCTQNQYQSIACVIPDLGSKRFQIQRKLSKKLPAAQFNISSPVPLIAYPIVSDILLLLDWFEEKITKAHINLLLFSDYFHFKSHASTTDFSKIPGTHCSYLQFYACLPKKNLAYYTKPLQQDAQTFTAWCNQIQNILHTIMPPQIGSAQALARKFYEKLNLLHTLSLDNCLVSYSHFLKTLRWILKDTPYEPEVNHHAPIQVLGPLETAGLSFDKIWFFASNGSNWPPPIKANPFIAHTLQESKQIPQGNPKRSFEFYQAIFQQISSASEIVIYSYSQYVDSLPIQISPFIQMKALPYHFSKKSDEHTMQRLETIVYDPAPAFTGDKLPGGTQSLSLQALCPFKNFASTHLNLKAFDAGTDYIDSNMRGQLVHAIFAAIWKYFKTQSNFKRTQDQHAFIIKKIISDLLSQSKLNHLLSETVLNLEKDRLYTLISDWLHSVEMKRSDFCVQQIETSGTIIIENVSIPFRIDRIDQIDNKQNLIIDYKTGLCSVQSWLKTPLPDPQLPLYLLATHADGIAFAQVRHKEMAFKAVCSDWPEWEILKNNWKKTIQTLVRSIQGGSAQAHPINPQICKYCDYPSLCRIVDYDFVNKETN